MQSNLDYDSFVKKSLTVYLFQNYNIFATNVLGFIIFSFIGLGRGIPCFPFYHLNSVVEHLVNVLNLFFRFLKWPFSAKRHEPEALE
jgi:hypothetical protein